MEEIAFQIDNAIINGSGAGQRLGVINSSATVTAIKETGPAASTVVFVNFLSYGPGCCREVKLMKQVERCLGE